MTWYEIENTFNKYLTLEAQSQNHHMKKFKEIWFNLRNFHFIFHFIHLFSAYRVIF